MIVPDRELTSIIIQKQNKSILYSAYLFDLGENKFDVFNSLSPTKNRNQDCTIGDKFSTSNAIKIYSNYINRKSSALEIKFDCWPG